MFRFLLKKKYNFFHNDLILVLAFILHFSIPAVLTDLITDFFDNQLGNFIAFLIFSFIIIISSFLILSIFKAINKYRESTPYKIEKVIENNKELEVRHYPSLSKIEHYYKGELHREDKPAVIILKEQFASPAKVIKKFYLFGKEYESESALKEAQCLLILQNNVENF